MTLRDCYITVFVAVRAILPVTSPGEASIPLRENGTLPRECVTVQFRDISAYLADFSLAKGENGRFSAFYPGCRAPAAVFVLFRLKRQGFSNCVATATTEGLLIEATR
jgi:hypothetical protein